MARSTPMFLTLLISITGCDGGEAEVSLRSSQPGHHHGGGQHGGHHGGGHHGGGHHGGGHHGGGHHGGGHHGDCDCDELDISDLLANYDEATNPYSDPEMWLSGPDALDDHVLDVNLDTTIVHSDLSTEVIHPQRPQDPDLDIFFVHPTVNLSMIPGIDDLSDLTNTQSFVAESAARFSTIGRVIAPFYHSTTAGAFLPGNEALRDELFEVSYQDVEDAFLYYLANHWKGRKLVIMGWSQGAIMTRMLVQRLVADHPDLMSRVVAVVPMSGDLQVDSFESIPACSSVDQTGCYIAYNSYLEGAGPIHDPPTAFGAWAGTPTTACTNVAGALDEAGTFSMSYFSLPVAPGLLPSDALADIPVAIETPFFAFPGFYEADCVDEDGRYLEVRQADSNDPRWAPIDYTHPFVSNGPPFGLGLHIFDFSLGMGDLLAVIDAKAGELDDEDDFCVVE